MKAKTALKVGSVGLAALACGLANANNITINDPFSDSGFFTTPYTNPLGVNEAGTVQSGATTGNSWDLASFDLTGTTLTMNGGFNFKTGVGSGHADSFPVGDIFVYSGVPYSATSPYAGKDGWSYVIHFDRVAAKGNPDIVGASVNYQIIPKGSEVGYEYTQDPSALIKNLPWMVGDPTAPTWLSGTYTSSGSGNTFMNSIAVDVSSILGGIPNPYLNVTMRCGNDVMWGHVPDGGTTLMLLGMGLGGLAFASRRNRK